MDSQILRGTSTKKEMARPVNGRRDTGGRANPPATQRRPGAPIAVTKDTRQRRAIRRTVQETDRPLTPREILVLAQAHCPRIGLATIYRTLRGLTEEGWLAVVELPKQPTRFERAGKAHHHHFHCRACGQLFEVERCDARIRELAPPDFTVEGHDLVFRGLCDSCGRS